MTLEQELRSAGATSVANAVADAVALRADCDRTGEHFLTLLLRLQPRTRAYPMTADSIPGRDEDES